MQAELTRTVRWSGSTANFEVPQSGLRPLGAKNQPRAGPPKADVGPPPWPPYRSQYPALKAAEFGERACAVSCPRAGKRLRPSPQLTNGLAPASLLLATA